MNAHKENLNDFFEQTKEISELRAKFYIEKFLLKHCAFSIIHATLTRPTVNWWGGFCCM